MLWPLCQPGESLHGAGICYGCCNSCCISQDRINVSAVPVAPQVFFQPLSSRLAYPEFNKQSKQCEQQDNWRCEQDQRYN